MFLNFKKNSLSVLKENVGYQEYYSLNAHRNSNQQSDLGLHCLSQPFWLDNSCSKFQNILHNNGGN